MIQYLTYYYRIQQELNLLMVMVDPMYLGHYENIAFLINNHNI